MNISVQGAQVNFVDGKLALGYFNVTFNAGTFPNSLNGNLQITPDENVTLDSTQEEVAAIAKAKIEAMVAEAPKKD